MTPGIPAPAPGIPTPAAGSAAAGGPIGRPIVGRVHELTTHTEIAGYAMAELHDGAARLLLEIWVGLGRRRCSVRPWVLRRSLERMVDDGQLDRTAQRVYRLADDPKPLWGGG